MPNALDGRAAEQGPAPNVSRMRTREITSRGAENARSHQIEQRGDRSEDQWARQSKMGKPVRKTIKSGLLPSAVAWRPMTDLKVRETALGLGAHTATPNKNRM